MNLSHLLVDTFVHMPPAQMLADLTEADAARKPEGAPHSILGIVAHLDFWQSWFLKRCGNEPVPMAAQASMGWPAVAPGDWSSLRDRFLTGLREAASIGGEDLERPLDPPIEFPPLANYTVADALTHIAAHNSHHLGQVVLLRQMLGIWPPPSGSWTW